MSAKVYIVKTSPEIDRHAALERLLSCLTPFQKLTSNEIVPVKITVGDTKCVFNLDPKSVKLVVSDIQKHSARPFLFDTNVIYSGARSNAVSHMTLAQNKGFGQTKTGAPFIIADGVLGTDGTYHETGTEHIKRIRIPSFIGHLDSLVVLSHVTGHILSGYAGAIKNVAMGMACRATKQVEHSSVKPSVITTACTACGQCVNICPSRAVSFKEGKASIDGSKCIGCGECLCVCKFFAIKINWHEDPDIFSKRMAEVAGFILSKFKNKFFINFAFDITKECDCISTKDEKMIRPDIGILASDDPLALDKATFDIVNGPSNIFALEKLNSSGALFEHAARLGIGDINYTLTEI